MKNCAPVFMLALLFTLPGCGNSIKGFLARKGQPSALDSASKPARVLNRDVASNGATFQVKSADQIARSIEVCLGNDVMAVLPEMILGGAIAAGAPAPVAAGAPAAIAPAAFLDPSFAADVGQHNIVLAQAKIIDGDQAALRAGVRADGASFPYLTALVNVANTVAYNCELERQHGDKSGLCKCETPEKASELLQRCLPNVNNNTDGFKALQLDFAQTCALDRKAAVASLIASYAFAKTP